MKSKDELIDDLLTPAFAEDVGDGDHTIPALSLKMNGKQQLIIKEAGILAGVEVAKKVFEKFDPSQDDSYLTDGAHVKPGDVAFVAEGKVRPLFASSALCSISCSA